MKKRINENQKVTLTLGQLRRLIKESSNWQLNEATELSKEEIKDLIESAFSNLDDEWNWGEDKRGQLSYMRAYQKIIDGDPSKVIKQIIDDSEWEDEPITRRQLMPHKDTIAKIASEYAKDALKTYCDGDSKNGEAIREICYEFGIDPEQLPPFCKERYFAGKPRDKYNVTKDSERGGMPHRI